MMKNTVKSILALALVALCGMAEAKSYTRDFANDSMAKADGYSGGSVSGKKLTTGDGSDLVYVAGGSNDGLNRNAYGWYAGATITWPGDEEINAGKAKHVLSFPSQTVYANAFAAGSGLTYDNTYMKHTYWWTWITPEQAYAAKSAGEDKITRTITINGEETNWVLNKYKVNASTFTVEFPLVDANNNDIVLKANGVKWYPAVAQIGTKVYGDLNVAIKTWGTVNCVAKGDITEAITVPENSTLVLNKGSYTITGLGNLTLMGGTFDFEPKAAGCVIATGYEVQDNGNNTWTVIRGHEHQWEFTLNGATLTANCKNTTSECDVPSRTTSITLTVTGGSDGVAPTIEIANQKAFLATVNKSGDIVSIGAITTVRTTEDDAALSRWYVGNYRSTCNVTIEGEGVKTLVKDFSIAKPEGGYKSGWEVGSTGIRYLEEDLSIVYKTAADGDTIYYRDGNRNFVKHEFSIGEKNITLDFCGATLKYTSGVNNMTIKNAGTGTLTLRNVTIQQPKYAGISYQVLAEGKIVFGDGVKTTNEADNKDRYLKITVNSGSLIVSNGLYQCSFATAEGATVLLEGGKYWANAKPALGQYDLADRVCREISEVIGGVTYKYEIVEHVHVFAYTAEGVVITCKCEGEDKEACYWYQKPQTATLTVNDADESSEPYAGASVSYDVGFIDQTQPITYWQGETQLSGAPTRFGTYTAKLTVGSATAAKSFTIRPMKVSITVPDAAHGKVTQVLDGETVVTSETTTYSVTHGNKITATYAADNGYEPATLTATLDCAEPGDTVTAPTFTAINYAISYTLNGGKNDPANPASYTIEQAVTLKPATKTGYTFTGWTPDGGVIAVGSTDAKTFTANWTPTVYSISYELNGGVNNPSNPTTYAITNDTITLAAPTRTGYEFTGWTPDGGVIAKGSYNDKTFTATWTATVYKVEFRDAVTEETKAETMTYTIETPSPLALRDLPTPEQNYTAKGWLTDRLDVAGQEATDKLVISEDMLGNKTFYVHFVFQTPEDPLEPDAPQVVIPQTVLTNIVEDAETKTAEEINEELNTPSNGVTKVERYVLGLDMKDMNDVPVIQPEQTADATTVRVNVGNIEPLPANVANAKVMYSIETSSTPGFEEPTQGDPQAEPTFDLPLPKSGVLYYRAKIDLVKPE